jgi:outer membrane protein assembly factor BamB
MRYRPLRWLALPAVAVATAAIADLPIDGWPQPRRDARLTARGLEIAPRDPVVAWQRQVGEALAGEPAAQGCKIVVGNGSGEIIAVNARGGDFLWRTAGPRASCGSAAVMPSSVAVDSSGSVVAGLAGDSVLLEAVDMLCRVIGACGSYAIDNVEYPPGNDLNAELLPIYITDITNPCTGAPAIDSDVPSPGDLRYERASPSEFYLGMWWTDGGLLDISGACGTLQGALGLHPSWPATRDLAGRGNAFDGADGARLWQTAFDDLAAATMPVVVPGGVVITQEGVATRGSWAVARGRVARIALDGSTAWEWRRAGGCRGAAARDEASGDLYVAQADSNLGDYFNTTVRALATAIESYAIDNSAHPPTGELGPLVVPMYLGAMPPNAYTGAPMRWSTIPSAGDYDYLAWNSDSEYRLAIWNDLDQRVAVMETGSFVQVATDRFSAVTRLAADGSLLRHVRVSATATVTPLLIADDGAIVIADAEGNVLSLDPVDFSERWRVPTGEPLLRAPVLLPGNVPVFVTEAGVVLAVSASGVLWRHVLGASATTDLAVSLDGVTLVGDETGSLHAIAPDGSSAWTIPLGGVSGIRLTTTPILHEGLILVGRADGVLVAVSDGPTSWLPQWPGGMLRAWRTSSLDDARLEWSSVALPDVPGAHYHLRRYVADPQGSGVHALAHDAIVTEHVDATPGERIVFYDLNVADCGENDAPR